MPLPKDLNLAVAGAQPLDRRGNEPGQGGRKGAEAQLGPMFFRHPGDLRLREL
jgi:hypothetical protein